MEHGLNHIFDVDTKIVILGTFPSVASRNVCYYNHPKNIFWTIMAECLNKGKALTTPDERYQCLKKHHIGLWDVIKECDFIKKSSLDSLIIKESIKYNDFNFLRSSCPKLKYLLFSSQNASAYFQRYLKVQNSPELENWLNNLHRISLPSTSPANARLSPNEKALVWENTLNSII